MLIDRPDFEKIRQMDACHILDLHALPEVTTTCIR
jgi:hypothetical protein